MKIKTVSEWINGNKLAESTLFESPVKESDKALGFTVDKINANGYSVPAVCWFPKSKLVALANDYYQNGAEVMYMVPNWLLNAKRLDGFEL